MSEPLPADRSQTLAELEAKIRATPPAARCALQPDLHRVCDRLSREGHELPERLRALDRNLTEAVVEAQFDNLPV